MKVLNELSYSMDNPPKIMARPITPSDFPSCLSICNDFAIYQTMEREIYEAWQRLFSTNRARGVVVMLGDKFIGMGMSIFIKDELKDKLVKGEVSGHAGISILRQLRNDFPSVMTYRELNTQWKNGLNHFRLHFGINNSQAIRHLESTFLLEHAGYNIKWLGKLVFCPEELKSVPSGHRISCHQILPHNLVQHVVSVSREDLEKSERSLYSAWSNANRANLIFDVQKPKLRLPKVARDLIYCKLRSLSLEETLRVLNIKKSAHDKRWTRVIAQLKRIGLADLLERAPTNDRRDFLAGYFSNKLEELRPNPYIGAHEWICSNSK